MKPPSWAGLSNCSVNGPSAKAAEEKASSAAVVKMRIFIADSLYSQQYLSKDKAIIGRSGNGGVPERLNDMRKQTADKPFQSGKRPSESLKYGFQTAFYFYGRCFVYIWGGCVYYADSTPGRGDVAEPEYTYYLKKEK